MNDALEVEAVETPSFFAAAEALSLGMPFQIHASADGKDGRFTYVGAGCEPLNGVSADGVLADGRMLTDLIAPEDLKRLGQAQVEALAENRPYDVVVSMRAPDGGDAWRRIVAAPKRLADGSVLWTGLVSDVTALRQMGRQLRAERERLQLALDVTGAGIFQWDRTDPDAIFWSPRQYEIMGVSPATPIDRAGSFGAVHPDDRAAVTAAYDALGSNPGGDFALEHRIVTPDGETRWVSVHGRVVHDEAGPLTVHGTTLDITERKLAEEQRQLQMRELAHRGKNALSVMMAMVRQASRGAKSVQELAEVLLARLSALASSQDLAMAAGGRPIGLARLVGQVLAPFDLRRFNVDPAISEVELSGDAASGLALLLHELATNAVKYGALSNQRGRVAITLEAAQAGSAIVVWRERGGPRAVPPVHRGFGSRVIETALQSAGGSAKACYGADGLTVRMSFPAA